MTIGWPRLLRLKSENGQSDIASEQGEGWLRGVRWLLSNLYCEHGAGKFCASSDSALLLRLVGGRRGGHHHNGRQRLAAVRFQRSDRAPGRRVWLVAGGYRGRPLHRRAHVWVDYPHRRLSGGPYRCASPAGGGRAAGGWWQYLHQPNSGPLALLHRRDVYWRRHEPGRPAR